MQLSSRYKPFAEYLRKLEAEEVFELEEQIAALVKQPGWAKLVEIVEHGRENLVSAFTDGPTLEQADYARLGGFTAGLEQVPLAAEAIRVVADKLREEIEHDARGETEDPELAPDGLTPAT